jgi:hypothetical protein
MASRSAIIQNPISNSTGNSTIITTNNSPSGDFTVVLIIVGVLLGIAIIVPRYWRDTQLIFIFTEHASRILKYALGKCIKVEDVDISSLQLANVQKSTSPAHGTI